MGERQPVAGLSFPGAALHHLEEGRAHANALAGFVAGIDPAVLPRVVAGRRLLADDVSRSEWSVRFDWITTIVLIQPNGSEVALPSEGGLHVATGDEQPGSVDASESERCAIGRIERDLIRGFHRDGLRAQHKKGRSF